MYKSDSEKNGSFLLQNSQGKCFGIGDWPKNYLMIFILLKIENRYIYITAININMAAAIFKNMAVYYHKYKYGSNIFMAVGLIYTIIIF